MYIVLTILAELIFVSLLIILFYRLKPRFGLAPLYILLGTNQYFQTVLASSFYIKLFGELSISPGNVILFSSSLFAILFIYIKEGVRSTQVLIMGIVLANLSVTFLASITHLQETVMKDIIIASGTAPDFFITNFRIFFVGTVTLILDAFIMVILYEFFFTKVRGLNLFTRLLITMLVVLNFDAAVFVLGSFWGSADLGNQVVSQLVSKSAVAVFFAAVLYFYLYYQDNERNNADVKEKKGKEDIFSILTYKGKFEKLKTEKTISDEQLQKSITDKTEELKNSVRRFTILSSVHELRVDKFSSAEQAGEYLKRVREAFEIDACTIHLLKDEKLIMLTSVGIEKNEEEEILVSTTPYFKEIIGKKKCLAIEDTGKDQDWVKGREMGLVKFNYISCLGAPLLSGDKVIGVIKLYSRTVKRVLTAIEIEQFRSVARQVAHTIVNAQLYEQNEKHKEVLVRQIIARKKAVEETIKSNQRFELIGKAANDAVWEWNLETNEFWGNEIHMNLYGLTRNDPEPGDGEWKRRLHHEDRERMLQTIDDALASDVNSLEAEYRLFTETKGWINIYGRNYIERNAAGKAIRMLGSMMDITERKKAEQALAENENYLRTILDTEPECVKVLNNKGELLSMNPAGLAMIEADNEQQVLGHRMTEVVNDKYRMGFNRLSKEVFNGNSGTFEFEVTGLKGGHRWLETHAVPLKDADGKIINLLGVTRDITEHKKVEKEIANTTDQLRQLTAHLQNIREEERKRISREIHDELGQQLTVLKMDASWLRKKMGESDTAVRTKIDELIIMLDDTVKSVRRISSELRPSLLDDLGLIAAIEWQLGEFEKRFGISTSCIHLEEELEIPDNAKTAFFRIFQESLTNVARHSQAQKVIVSISEIDNQLVLSIEDNGNGFDKQKIADKKTLGILGMKERTAMIDGEYEISTTPGKGTLVTVKLGYDKIKTNKINA